MSEDIIMPTASLLPATEGSYLAQFLLAFAARANHLCYVPNIGNAGDALIASGAWQLFDRIGIRPQMLPAEMLSEGASAIYAGGGNLTPYYQSAADFLRKCLAVGVKEAIVLPHTIRGHRKLLEQLDKRFTLVCRDQPSFEWCTTAAAGATTLFSHDLALQLDVPRLQSAGGLISFTAHVLSTRRVRQFHRYVQWRLYTRSVQPVDGTLRIFRVDVEAVSHLPGDRTQDISAAYTSEYLNRAEHELVAQDFLTALGRADFIITNRLHVGIAGALLGKRVHLHENSYGKIRDVYQASLRDCALIRYCED